MKFAILGIGEVGFALASDLIAAGAEVYGWDPEPKRIPAGAMFMNSNPDAASRADIVLSVNWDIVSVEVAEEVSTVLKAGQLYADMNTASPSTKRQIEKVIVPSGALFADVAIMAPILPRGIRTPTLASGSGRERFQIAMSAFEMPVTILDEQAGSAATRKLLRSTFYKGLAAVVVETLEAARHLGYEEWVREQMLTIINDPAMIDRFEIGSRQHAERRTREMKAVCEMLRDIGVNPITSEASVRQLQELQKAARLPSD